MKGLVGISPLHELHNILMTGFKSLVNNKWKFDKDISTDDICTLILQNNGCPTGDLVSYKDTPLECMDNYIIRFAYGAKGNAVNEFYDYIEFFNYKYLIVFADCFQDMWNEPDPVFGKGEFMDKISKLVDVFISTTTSAAEINGALGATCASNMYRFAPTLIAASIIDQLFGLKPKDITTMPYEEVRDMLDNISLPLLLVGVRTNNS